MSGSPKYHEVRASELRRQRAEQERKERERRRREEERKRREKALKRAIAGALARLDEAGRRLEALRAEATAAGVGTRVDAVVRDLADTRRAVSSASSEKELRKAGDGLDRVERGLTDVRFRADDHKQRQAVDRIAHVADLVAGVPADVRVRYDRDGHDEVEEQIARARRQATTDPAGATKRADALAARAREHVDRVLARRHEHETRLAAAASVIEDLGSRLTVLEAEAAENRVPLSAGPQARAAVAGLHDALRRGDLDAVHAGAAAAQDCIAHAEREFDVVIDRIVERRQVLESIVAALPATGFEVDRNSFREDADGSLELRAFSSSGQAFAVLVRDNADAQTEVLYTTDSMAGEIATGAPGRSCGPLVEIIGRLSEEARNNGFEPGQVRWDDDPDRPPPGQGVRPVTAPKAARGGVS